MSSEPQVDERFRQIPVCRRCRLRKIKCDRGVPKCSNCTKSSSACIIVDPITSEQYPRDYIRRLEDEERQLLAKLETLSPQDPPAIVDPPQDDETPRSLPSTVSTARPNGFVGDGSGLRQVKLLRPCGSGLFLTQSDTNHRRTASSVTSSRMQSGRYTSRRFSNTSQSGPGFLSWM
ncbi:hypothetical protein BKA56DRAFT_624508 [Ilyonectria sp. MPI-CAGE-AT-0026]|nr:hypothetical protein BKA56DRAFT_624508 [Ilyonectria sp. MPI-CAGE-AT-0026]